MQSTEKLFCTYFYEVIIKIIQILSLAYIFPLLELDEIVATDI